MQMEALECGAASLAMILGTYKRYIPLEQLRLDCGISRNGSNAKNIAIAAKHHGLQVRGLKITAEKIRSMDKDKFPMIIHWDFNHFVVLCGFRKDNAIIHDPAMGRVLVSKEQFEKSFTGVALLMTPAEGFQKCGNKKSVFHFLRMYLKGYGVSSTLLILTGLLSVIMGMFLPVYTKIFTDHVLVGQSTQWMKILAELMTVTILLSTGLSMFFTGLLNRICGKMSVEMSTEFMWHTLMLPVVFFSQRSPGDIVTRQTDNDDVAKMLFEKIVPAATSGVMACIYFGVLTYYNVKMMLVVLVVVAANLITARIATKKSENDSRMLMRDEAKFVGTAMAGISMMENIKSSGAEEGFFRKVTGYMARYDNTQNDMRKRNTIISMLPSLFQEFAGAVILLLGVLKIMHGEFTIGILLAFQGFFSSFLQPVNELMEVYQEIYALNGKLDRIQDVKEYKTDVEIDLAGCPQDTNREEKKLSGNVTLEHVSFGYQPLAAPLIEDFCLTVKPGQMVALTGGSGSGKSTIANLITGLYPVREGRILYDGMERKQMDRYVFVNSLGIVDQNIVIFRDSIRNNLTLWDDTVEESCLIQACKDAGIYEDILKHPEGFEYLLSEGGGNLSGGQRQRIEIARALLREPSILILDEATSALDPITEKQVMDAVKRRNITCIVIAHRLSAIRDADLILVLDKGKEVERGTHETLMNHPDGTYAALVQSED